MAGCDRGQALLIPPARSPEPSSMRAPIHLGGLRFISAESLLESVADIPVGGIGWVAVGGMSGPLHRTRRMQMRWAHEVRRRCLAAGAPFLFKQATDLYTERGIDGLARYIAQVEGRPYDSARALIRQYPVTDPPLPPFAEHGHRYRDDQWGRAGQDCGSGTLISVPKQQ